MYNNPVARGGDQLIYPLVSFAIPVDAICTMTVRYANGKTIKYGQTVLGQFAFTLPADAALGAATYYAECLSPTSARFASAQPLTFDVIGP